MRLNVKDMGIEDRLADLELIIWGENLHAPLVERVLELPMDIYAGTIALSAQCNRLLIFEEQSQAPT